MFWKEGCIRAHKVQSIVLQCCQLLFSSVILIFPSNLQNSFIKSFRLFFRISTSYRMGAFFKMALTEDSAHQRRKGRSGEHWECFVRSPTTQVTTTPIQLPSTVKNSSTTVVTVSWIASKAVSSTKTWNYGAVREKLIQCLKLTSFLASVSR